MAYAVLGDGKRVRPILAMASFEAVGGHGDAILPVAGALELIHAYSLVHDDLPAMDDDDYRRGRPTCHKAYDEATAVLVGDGLQTLAFSWLAEAPLGADTRVALVRELAGASGPWGMVGGQMADMAAASGPRDLDHLRFIHAHKTGALLTASARMGAIAGGADGAALAALTEYGRHVGLAFQVVDDILDVTADSATLGKTAGKDQDQNKLTYPALIGLERAREMAAGLAAAAHQSLAAFGDRAEPLRALASYVVERGK
ncbi:MAG: polyprenyl synthetase family protein [Nitrospirae bacterium]|nr:polyprenyl synthetase family protein [Nitrospirota bacterium]